MKALDFIMPLAFIAALIGFSILLIRWGGGGGGGQNVITPSSRAPLGGGWLPGGTTKGFRNGGVGAAQTEIWYN